MEKISSKDLYKMRLIDFVLVALALLMSIHNFQTIGLVRWELVTFAIITIIMYLIPALLTSAKLYKFYKPFPEADSITIDSYNGLYSIFNWRNRF